jgi:hypothetical protein
MVINSRTAFHLYFFSTSTRGGSDFSVTYTFNVSYTWNIPSSKQFSGVLGWIADGCEFGGIFQANSGVPFTLIIGGDHLGLRNTDPFDFPN